ncbi:MAG: MBL fold metallo-hydrolase [Patescibacteria group bacterium]
MFVSWLGASTIKIEYKRGEDNATVLIDPYQSKEIAISRAHNAEVVLLTRGSEEVVNGAKDPYTIEYPGEYETHDVAVVGFATPSTAASVVYRFSVEDLTCAHLGAIDQKLDDATAAELDGVDVLFVPVGGNGSLSADKAAELVTQIEPRVLIPICHEDSSAFLKQLGITDHQTEERAKLRKKDLPEATMTTIILTRS